MDLAARKKQGIERQTTFGPSAPIAEWELEKATILRELTENKERADRLQQKLEQDQLAFERNTTSLLKEVKLKEASWEKRRQETDTSWMNQILELQHQLDKERQDHEDAIQETKQQLNHTLQLEQKKYDRRMASLHSRLEEKEKVLLQYQSPTQELASTVLPSPVTPSTSSGFDLPSSVTTANHKPTHDHLRQIQRLEQQLIKHRRRNEQLERQLDHQQQTQPTGEQAQPSMTWEAERKDLESIYNKKIQAMIDLHKQEQQQLRENFMKENSEMAMHMEARLQNVQNEYENTIHEIRDEFATEKKVWVIEQQASIDQLKRQLEQQYADQLQENERVWANKLSDMDASLSNDNSQVKTYWEMKIETLVEAHNKERARLLGELEVIKVRLGNDIDRRHRVQADLATLESKYNQEHSRWTKQNHQLEELLAMKASMKKATLEYQNAKVLAASLLSALSMDEYDSLGNLPTSLVDLLHLSVRKATLVQVKTNGEKTLPDIYNDTFGNIF